MKRMQTILVVEDNTSLRKFVTSLLRDNGYRVLDTSNGKDALEIAGRHPGPIHALLADIILNGPMDGLELGSELRRIRPETRALYMSGYSGSFADRLELEALTDFFIAKPFSAKSLIAMVEACLAGELPEKVPSSSRAKVLTRR